MMHVLMIEDTEEVSIMMEKKASMLLWKINPNGAL